MEYYLAIKRKEVLMHVVMWVNLENMMLSEKSQTQKEKDCMISLTGNVQNRQIYISRRSIAGGPEKGPMGSDCYWVGCLFGVMKMFLTRYRWWLYSIVNLLNTTKLLT